MACTQCELLREQKESVETERDILKINIAKMKSKLVDVDSLANLFEESKQELADTKRLLAAQVATSEKLKEKVAGLKQELARLKESSTHTSAATTKATREKEEEDEEDAHPGAQDGIESISISRGVEDALNQVQHLLSTPGSHHNMRIVETDSDNQMEEHKIVEGIVECFRKISKSRPISSAHETALLELVYHLHTEPTYSGVVEEALRRVAHVIVMAPEEDLDDTDADCRLFVLVCKRLGVVDNCRILCFDLLRERPFIEVSLLLTVASMWPQVLAIPSRRGGKRPRESEVEAWLPRTIEIVVLSSYLVDANQLESMDEQSKEELKLLDELKRACGWRTTFDAQHIADPEAYLLDWVEKLVGGLQTAQSAEESFDIAKCLELVGLSKGWVWTYDSLLIGKLWPLLAPTSSPTLLEAVVALIGCLGRMAGDDSEETGKANQHRQVIVYLIEKLSFILKQESGPADKKVKRRSRGRKEKILDDEVPEGTTGNFTLSVKVAAAQSILFLAMSMSSGDNYLDIESSEAAVLEGLTSWISSLPDSDLLHVPREVKLCAHQLATVLGQSLCIQF